jgi:predicted metalloprotease
VLGGGGIPDLGGLSGGGGVPAEPGGTLNPQGETDQQLAAIVADIQAFWGESFSASGRDYPETKLVLFDGSTQSACGPASSATGPFYCPADQKVYIDLDFYKELKSRFSAPGDFAQAYVIAHEIGHHVQTLLGITEQVEALKARMGQRQANAVQVRMELQADCFAGVWANRADETRNIVEPGDIDEALNAASAIGDDRIQRQTTGYVVPDAFTHGSSGQRVRWFKRGFESGKLEACDTFNADEL